MKAEEIKTWEHFDAEYARQGCAARKQVVIFGAKNKYPPLTERWLQLANATGKMVMFQEGDFRPYQKGTR